VYAVRLGNIKRRKQFVLRRIVELWNTLPEEVVSVSSISSFKRHYGWVFIWLPFML